YKLIFGTSGNLRVTEIASGTVVWTVNIGGYMACNEEDGNLVVYDSSWIKIWSTSTGASTTSCSESQNGLVEVGCSFSGYGGDLVLVGPQLRLVTAAGDPSWSNGYCSSAYAWACSKD